MVAFSPDVEKDILGLVDVLIEEGYICSYPFAVKYVDDLIDYIESNIDICVRKEAPSFFYKYGKNLKYMTYHSSCHTTWYILFEEHGDTALVKYITNNKFEGHYFNI